MIIKYLNKQRIKTIIYQLNPDLIRRIMVDVKGKTKIKE